MSYRDNLQYSHFAGAISSATQIKANPGVLHTLTINTVGATVGAIILQDGIVGVGSPPTIAVITPVANTTVAPLDCIYDVRFNVGLIISGSGATMDVTVSWE